MKRRAGLRLQSHSDGRHIHSGRYSRAIPRIQVVVPAPGMRRHIADPSCHRFGAAGVASHVIFALLSFSRHLAPSAHPHSILPPHNLSDSFHSYTWDDPRFSPVLSGSCCLLETVFPSLDLILLVVGFNPWMALSAHGFSATAASPSP